MRPKFLIWLPVIGLMTAAATPVMAQESWFGDPAQSYSHQSPSGSYITNLSRSIRGVPCGIVCSREAAMRSGSAPRQPVTDNYYRYRY